MAYMIKLEFGLLLMHVRQTADIRWMLSTLDFNLLEPLGGHSRIADQAIIVV